MNQVVIIDGSFVEVPRQCVYRKEREKLDAQIPDEGQCHQARCEE